MEDAPPEVRGLVRIAHKTLDAVSYGVLVVILVAGPAAFLELSGRGTLFTTKHLLFWVGFGLLAYASFQLRPPSPKELDDREGIFVTSGDDRQKRADTTIGGRSETTVEKVVALLPPMRWAPLRPDERFSVHAKLLVAAILMLALSMAMEFVFGVAQPGTQSAATAVRLF
ncbi:DUF7555 family protein [Haloarchaeobius sp. TZWWS8]|uniref:DUF7555 family protein n=1 Tax=Haloarchaeobius sp. TZWWS8 TaxID=3446121 RepID=UPI003EB889DF